MLRISHLIYLALFLSACGGDGGYQDGDGGCLDDGNNSENHETVLLPNCAQTVVAAPGATGEGNKDSSLAANGVRGDSGGSSDVYSLGYEEGVDNFIILSWGGKKVTNGPGTDFVVFENAFIKSGGGHFMDQIIVYLSIDSENWVAFPHDYINPDENEYSHDPNMWPGFAGLWPVFYHEEDNPIDPFDFDLAGGDHFDLDQLPDDNGLAQEIKANGFSYIRLVSAPSQINPDTGAAFVSETISNGADIDGVYARHLKPVE
jgi:hypothetical protein